MILHMNQASLNCTLQRFTVVLNLKETDKATVFNRRLPNVPPGSFIDWDLKTTSTRERGPVLRDIVLHSDGPRTSSDHLGLLFRSHPRSYRLSRCAVSQTNQDSTYHLIGQVSNLEGVAGAGKTTSLAAIREGVEREGYKVEGFAPTSRAAQELAEAGIELSTLQHHLAQSDEEHDGKQRLYVLDESSLASTIPMNAFLHRLQENDRVLLVGDTRQHQAVEAGTPYQQLQEAGIQTARLDEIVRAERPGA